MLLNFTFPCSTNQPRFPLCSIFRPSNLITNKIVNMKTVRPIFLLVSFLFISLIPGQAQNISGQDSTGLPGDHFSLQGALDLFKKSTSVEDFEKQLNTESNHVNNLDLNGDKKIDYIRVIDKTKGDAHALILQ